MMKDGGIIRDMDKTKFVFIIGVIIIAVALAWYPNISILNQQKLQTGQDQILKQLLENQQLIKINQETIKNITGTNLKNTFINKENIEAIHRDTVELIKTLNYSLGAHEQQDNIRFSQQQNQSK